MDYQPLDTDQIQEDLRFLLGKMARPRVGWHDPNFGVRFDEIMAAIEEAVPPGRIDFAAESSLSLLSEPHLRRLQANGFKAILPGIESWYSMGGKSKTGRSIGMEKVKQVSEHVNTILRYIPYVQANFVLGLDDDEGEEPFELTKRFVDLTPGAFPAYSLLSAFGQAAPLNLDLQREARVLPTPFHFLDNNRAMNVRPKNYSWAELYDNVIGLRKHSFSWRAVAPTLRGQPRRDPALAERRPRPLVGGLRAGSATTRPSGGCSTAIAPFRRFFEGETRGTADFLHRPGAAGPRALLGRPCPTARSPMTPTPTSGPTSAAARRSPSRLRRRSPSPADAR